MLSIGADAPGELLVAEIRENGYGEQTPASASEEMRGLPLVGAARFDTVVRPDGNIRLLLEILIEIPKQHAESSVRIGKPSFVNGVDALAGIVGRPDGDSLLRRYARRADRHGQRNS